jgi:hypothetical protein
VPVTPAGAGLTPGDAISVAPRGIPVWGTAEPIPKPSGEVAAIVGVGLTMPLICAMAAALQTTSAGRTAAINDHLIPYLLLKSSVRQGCLRSAWRVGLWKPFADLEPQTVIVFMLLLPAKEVSNSKVSYPPTRSIKYAVMFDDGDHRFGRISWIQFGFWISSRSKRCEASNLELGGKHRGPGRSDLWGIKLKFNWADLDRFRCPWTITDEIHPFDLQ